MTLGPRTAPPRPDRRCLRSASRPHHPTFAPEQRVALPEGVGPPPRLAVPAELADRHVAGVAVQRPNALQAPPGRQEPNRHDAKARVHDPGGARRVVVCGTRVRGLAPRSRGDRDRPAAGAPREGFSGRVVALGSVGPTRAAGIARCVRPTRQPRIQGAPQLSTRCGDPRKLGNELLPTLPEHGWVGR